MAVSDSFDRNSNRRGATWEILRARTAEVTLSNVKLCLAPPRNLRRTPEFRAEGDVACPDHRVSKHLFIRLHGTRRAAGYYITYLIFPAGGRDAGPIHRVCPVGRAR